MIGAPRARRGAATSDQQDVLDHVDAEQGRVVALDRRLEGEDDRAEAGQPADRPDPRDRVRRVGSADLPDRPQVARRGQAERDDDGRVERPGQQDVGQDRRRGRRCRGPRRDGAAPSQAEAGPARGDEPDDGRLPGDGGPGSPAHSAPDRTRTGPATSTGTTRSAAAPAIMGAGLVRRRPRVSRTPPHVDALAHALAPRGDRRAGRDGGPGGRLRLVRSTAGGHPAGPRHRVAVLLRARGRPRHLGPGRPV